MEGANEFQVPLINATFIELVLHKCLKWEWKVGVCIAKYNILKKNIGYWQTLRISLNINKFTACDDGYFGENCGVRCIAPEYGKSCEKKCDCPVERCHHAYGCQEPGKQL